jgi:hypothetical protein
MPSYSICQACLFIRSILKRNIHHVIWVDFCFTKTSIPITRVVNRYFFEHSSSSIERGLIACNARAYCSSRLTVSKYNSSIALAIGSNPRSTLGSHYTCCNIISMLNYSILASSKNNLFKQIIIAVISLNYFLQILSFSEINYTVSFLLVIRVQFRNFCYVKL